MFINHNFKRDCMSTWLFYALVGERPNRHAYKLGISFLTLTCLKQSLIICIKWIQYISPVLINLVPDSYIYNNNKKEIITGICQCLMHRIRHYIYHKNIYIAWLISSFKAFWLWTHSLNNHSIDQCKTVDYIRAFYR